MKFDRTAIEGNIAACDHADDQCVRMKESVMSDTPRTDIFKQNIRIDKNNCWIWQRSKNSRGYGLAWDGKKVVLAHRFSYKLFKTEPPKHMHVCHHCDNPICVNPEHLFLGTDRDNLIDCIKKGRRPKTGPTRGQCKNAHLNPHQAEKTKKMIKNRTGTLRQVANSLGISMHIIKDISRGKTY